MRVRSRPADFPLEYNTLVFDLCGEQNFDLTPTTVRLKMYYRKSLDGKVMPFFQKKTAYTDVPLPIAIATSFNYLCRFFNGKTPWLHRPNRVEIRLHNIFEYMCLTSQISRVDLHAHMTLRRGFRKLMTTLHEPECSIEYVWDYQFNRAGRINEPREFATGRAALTNWESGEKFQKIFRESMQNRIEL